MSTPEELDRLPWLQRLDRAIDDHIAEGKPATSIGFIIAALIRALHEKGVLSTQEKDALIAAWDRLDAANHEASERERKALVEQFPELAGSILSSTSDPP